MEKKTNYVEEARFLLSIGISVIPVALDGSKLPKIRWKEFQSRLMTDEEAVVNFSSAGGVVVITGKISNLICLDFDLDKSLTPEEDWELYMSHVPPDLKERMLINRTRSGGFHVYLRTDYEDKSRKIMHRPLLIPELMDRYESITGLGASSQTASAMLLRRPVQCVIETRSRGSYAVFLHPSYSRHQGTALNSFTKEEVNKLLMIAYSMDYRYIKPKPPMPGVNNFAILKKFNEDITAEKVVEYVEKTGMFTLHDIDSNGNYRMKRVGSGSLFSMYIYSDTGVSKIFGFNPLTTDDKDSFSPFEMYCISRDFTTEEGIEALNQYYNSNKE